ncbi:MAG: hypothetical protein HY331_11100, partial [Chloroflexi bacterium]|nr:hypothetical protein [Chloroflexota bacterium]
MIEVRVPRVRCACGGTVDVSFSVFVPYQRVSLEMAERVREAVATLLRDFEKTIVYLEVLEEAAQRGEVWDRKYLRTASALERLNRRLRQMVRQVVLFHSTAGLEARVYLVLLEVGALL